MDNEAPNRFDVTMDVEIAEIRDFLAQHEPYSMLPPTVLDALPRQLTARYYRRGTTLVAVGQENNNMYILRSGAVDIFDALGALTDRAGPGDSFGMSNVLAGAPSRYTLYASEDSLCLLMAAEVFHHLMQTQPTFSQFFVQQQAGRMRAAVQTVHVSDEGSAIMRTRVRETVRKKPITTSPETSIRDAAVIMTEKNVSALLVMQGSQLVGIITDRDLRSRVVAAGLDASSPVSSIMTASPVTIDADKLAFEVLVEMTQRKLHHLPVTEEGRLVGMITAGDLMRLEQANPAYLVSQIVNQTTIEGLKATVARVGTVVEHLVAQDATADDIARVITAIADATTRKVINFVEAEIGHPPVHYCWVALGSQGRLETGLQSDQDNAIILDDAVRPEHHPYFEELATKVVNGLAECGYHRCPGDMMASNPQWNQPLKVWGTYFSRWINEPTPDALLNAQTFFDMRPVYGDNLLFTQLQGAITNRTPNATRFKTYLATQAQRFQPPLGFFRDFVLEQEGEHRNTLDVKAGGITAIVAMARLFALANGIREVNTLARLRSAASLGALREENAADLADSFEFINYVRIRHQVRQIRAGEQPDNHVAPSELSSFEKRHLREAFQIIRKMQAALGFTHQTHLTS